MKLHDFPGYRTIAARLPLDHARALRVRAAATGQPLQALLQELVAQWFAINSAINNAPQRDTRAPVPAIAIPQVHKSPENTGRNEPFRTLKKIDLARKTSPQNATARD